MPSKYDKIKLPRHLDRRYVLTEDDVTTIKNLRNMGHTQKNIAAFIGCAQSTVAYICNPESKRKRDIHRKGILQNSRRNKADYMRELRSRKKKYVEEEL